jgi:aldose 1-epimerase
MFKIEEEGFGKYIQYNLRNTGTGEYVSVIPAFGATINQVALKKANTVFELIDGCKTYDELISEGKSKFKGSKLFPFSNRIADGRYIFANEVYNFPVNFPHEKNSIHGILLESNFKVVYNSAISEEAILKVEHKTTGEEPGYPFKVAISIEYKLNKDGFSCTTVIENNDSKTIPVGDGWHPYFKIGSKMDDCILSLPVECSYEVDQRMIPTGKRLEEKEFNKPVKIGSAKFDTGYKLTNTGGNIHYTTLENPVHKIKLVFWQEGGEGKYNYLQIYIPPDRQSIAIEPMTCLANAFNNQIGLICLKSKECIKISFGIRIE